MEKFKDWHKYSKPVTVAESNMAKNKNLEFSKTEQLVIQVVNDSINANGTKEEETHSSYQSSQDYSLVTDSRKQREKRKTYAESLKHWSIEGRF